LKVIQVPFTYYPAPVGGTEIYVESLSRQLQQQQVNVLIAAPDQKTSAYEHNGLTVRRFAISDKTEDIRELYNEGNISSAHEFGELLDEETPDVVHQHAFTRGVSLRLMREAKRRKIKTVFTYHTPTVSCQRGTLMRWGNEVCDGRLHLQACSACTLQSLGLNKMSALVLGSIPQSVGRLAGAAGLSGGAWTALRTTELLNLRRSSFRSLMEEVDQVVAICEWVKDLLTRNGVPKEKITVSRQGLPQSTGIVAANPIPHDSSPLRIAFLGRFDPTKGADLIINAVRTLPEAKIELHLYGIVQDGAGESYLRRLKELAGEDQRISFLPPVASHRVVTLLREYHLLAVPSRWLETGPLVVLEAFAAGTPVIGANLGGVAEQITDHVNGLLVETDSIKAWTNAINRFLEDKALLPRLRNGIRPPRSIDMLASDMLQLYKSLTVEGKFQNRVAAG
jgi:glycosyltransferase involved in cell wall biosynthesis